MHLLEGRFAGPGTVPNWGDSSGIEQRGDVKTGNIRR